MTIREKNVHDRDPVRQGHVSAFPFTPFAIASEPFACQLCLPTALTHGRFASSLCLCLAKPTGGHRPLLMMSFLRRLALKSVMAAKKESVAKCAGPLQYGVGRLDGANTMIKTIQYLAEADNS